MNYQETVNFLFESAPLFQQIGGSAYKEGLNNTEILDAHFGHPHRNYRTIHIGGTNGKGSCSHTIAAILQEAGYKVGLYTSPHLIDFRERIRINGIPISEEYVVQFVEKERYFFEPLHPSFFELTTALAFTYFSEQKIDIAIVEVGLGGRLDCTNIINPDLSIITNISFDHTQFLGNTLKDIASEKAGIIKASRPVVIGETTPDTRMVFTDKATEVGAPIYFAEDTFQPSYPHLEFQLKGIYQEKNKRTILTAISLLKEMKYDLPDDAIYKGFANVCQLTGLMGRWQQLQSHPTLICDTGHNVAGIKYIVEQLEQQEYLHLHIVIGMVNDKDIRGVLKLLPTNATYYFTKANVKRALNECDLQELAHSIGLIGNCYPNVSSAVQAAQKESLPEDFIFVGGSSFIVADLLANRNTLNLD